jgi:hypothetical protein
MAVKKSGTVKWYDEDRGVRRPSEAKKQASTTVTETIQRPKKKRQRQPERERLLAIAVEFSSAYACYAVGPRTGAPMPRSAVPRDPGKPIRAGRLLPRGGP